MKYGLIIVILIVLSTNCRAFEFNISNYLPKQEVVSDTFKVALVTIKYIESKGNYNARGKKGELGSFQFLPSTWNSLCKRYFKVVLKPTKFNQDVIATCYVKELLQKHNINELASIWNCGVKQPNNKQTIKYVNSFLQIFALYYSVKELVVYSI